MKSRRKEFGISFKIALIFMILMGIFWIILFVQFYYSGNQEAKEYVESLSDQAMSSISKNIEMIIGNVSFHSRQILADDDLIYSLKTGQPEQQQKSLSQFISLTDFESYMIGIYIMDMKDHMCSIDRLQVRTLRVQHISDIEWYEEVLNLNGSYCLKLNADRVLTGSSAHPTISLIRAIIDPSNFQKIGILMINIDLEAFESYCDNLENVPNLYILDDTGKIIYSKSEMKLPEMQKNRKQETETVVNDILFDSLTIESNGWTIFLASPIIKAFSGVKNSRRFLIQTIEILALFSIGSYLIINYLVGRPLINMAKRMNIQKNYRFEKLTYKEKPFRSCREVEQLKVVYNEMTEDINDLVRKVTEDEKFKRKVELKILYEQIKPHFLYNTIDALTYLALTGQNEELCNSLEAFGGFYRNLLSKGRDVIPVKNEIEMIKDYLDLQKLRYGNEISYEIWVDEEISNFKVLKMILQPFVENSIIHGIHPKGQAGIVIVKGERKGNFLYFSISDDGVGMNQDTIAQLLGGIRENRKSFGVRGTIERMCIFYEMDIPYGINSSSSGTEIWFRLPVIEEHGGDSSDTGIISGR